MFLLSCSKDKELVTTQTTKLSTSQASKDSLFKPLLNGIKTIKVNNGKVISLGYQFSGDPKIYDDVVYLSISGSDHPDAASSYDIIKYYNVDPNTNLFLNISCTNSAGNGLNLGPNQINLNGSQSSYYVHLYDFMTPNGTYTFTITSILDGNTFKDITSNIKIIPGPINATAMNNNPGWCGTCGSGGGDNPSDPGYNPGPYGGGH